MSNPRLKVIKKIDGDNYTLELWSMENHYGFLFTVAQEFDERNTTKSRSRQTMLSIISLVTEPIWCILDFCELTGVNLQALLHTVPDFRDIFDHSNVIGSIVIVGDDSMTLEISEGLSKFMNKVQVVSGIEDALQIIDLTKK